MEDEVWNNHGSPFYWASKLSSDTEAIFGDGIYSEGDKGGRGDVVEPEQGAMSNEQ